MHASAAHFQLHDMLEQVFLYYLYSKSEGLSILTLLKKCRVHFQQPLNLSKARDCSQIVKKIYLLVTEHPCSLQDSAENSEMPLSYYPQAPKPQASSCTVQTMIINSGETVPIAV